MERVNFFNVSILLNTQYQIPYRFVWKNVPAGTYTITAVAIDNWGARTTSAAVTIRVTSQGAMIVSNKPSSADNKVGVSTAEIVSLAPNPTNNIVTIYTTGLPQNKQTKISVISSLGAVM